MTTVHLWSRPLVPLVLALAAGMAAPSFGWALDTYWLLAAAAGWLIFMVVLLQQSRSLAWAGCLLCFFLGQGLYQSSLNPALPGHHVRCLPIETPISLQGLVHSRPVASVSGDRRFELAASSWFSGGEWQPASGLVLVSGLGENSELHYGDRVVVRLTLWPVEDLSNPGSAGRRAALARRQIFVTGKIWQHLQPVRLAGASELSRLAAWRQQVQDYCRRLLESQPQPARSIFLALLLGDQSEISQPLRQAFNSTGTTHVLSVSGLHLVIIATFFTTVFFWLLRRSVWLLLRINVLKTAICLSAIPVMAYVWVSEGSPATQRSAVMILAYIVLMLLDRHRDVYSVLTLAALVILVASPLQLYAVSFQLSFLAVWGLAYLSPPLSRSWCQRLAVQEGGPDWRQKIYVWLAQAFSVSLAATLATLPVIIANFHQAPTYGIIANIAVTPLIGGLAVVIVFSSLPLSLLSSSLTSGLLFFGRLIIDVSVYLIQWIAFLPGSVFVRLPAPTVWQTGGYFLVLISLFGASRGLRRWTGISLGLLVLTGSLVLSGISRFSNSELVLTALDNPRELALVTAFPGGAAMVINGGIYRYGANYAKSNFALISYLHERRLRHLDYLAALSVTDGNAGTLLALAREFDIGEFWYGGDGGRTPAFWEMRNILGDARKVVKNLSLSPVNREIGGVQMQTRQLPGIFPNRTSGPVLLQLGYQGKKVLIVPPAPADWRQLCLDAGLSPSQVLVLPSSNLQGSFLDSCLDQVKPNLVIVTGLPPANMEVHTGRYDGISWHFTRQGAVTLTIDAGPVRVSQWQP